jgi:hypothetical protein
MASKKAVLAGNIMKIRTWPFKRRSKPSYASIGRVLDHSIQTITHSVYSVIKISGLLRGDLAGDYFSLSKLSPEEEEKLLAQHLLFPKCDR